METGIKEERTFVPKKDGIENVFLTYANSPLKSLSQGLITVMETARDYYSFANEILNFDDEFYYIIDLATELAQFGSPGVAHRKFQSLKSNKKYKIKEIDYHNPEDWWDGSFDFDAQKAIGKWESDKNFSNSHMWCREVAFAYVYGYIPVEHTFLRGCDNCHDFCKHDGSASRVLESPLFDPDRHINCWQCRYLMFKYALNEIIERKEYSDMDCFLGGIEELNPTENKRRYKKEDQAPFLDIANTRSPFKEEIRSNIEYIPNEYDTGGEFFPTIEHYDIFLSSTINHIVKTSLVCFLITNDRRKLKYCQECNKFYTSKSVHPAKFCSDKCRMAYNNRKRIESGEAREYKRKKRMEGAKESYYG